jgi:hypothetical protein
LRVSILKTTATAKCTTSYSTRRLSISIQQGLPYRALFGNVVPSSPANGARGSKGPPLVGVPPARRARQRWRP